MTKLYAYVGPRRILDEVRHQAPGTPISTLADLRSWLQAPGAVQGREVTATFVVGEAGTLRLADRHTEHAVCAGANRCGPLGR